MSEFLTHKEFETWCLNLEGRLTSLGNLLSILTVIQGGSYITKPLIQVGRSNIDGTGTTIIFTVPFKVGTIPKVVGTSEGVYCIFCLNGIPTATQFTAKSRWHDGTAFASDCNWIAIGEKT